MTLVYGLTRCDTCRKARAWLDRHGIGHAFVDYREQPIAPAALAGHARQLGWDKLVNRASTSWRQLGADERTAVTDAEWLALLAAHPTLIRRPLLVLDDGRVAAGFSDSGYRQLFGMRLADGTIGTG